MTKNNYELKDLSNEESEKQSKNTIDLSNSELEETSHSNDIIECFEQNNENNNNENIDNEEVIKLKKLLKDKGNKLSDVSKTLQEKLYKIEELIIDKKRTDEQFDRLKKIEIPKLVQDKEETFEKLSLIVSENSLLRERIEEIGYEKTCKCNCKCKDCICNKTCHDKSSTEKKTSDELVSDHDNLMPNDVGLNNKDPFKILLQIITIFDEIKQLIKKINSNINEYYYRLNMKQQDNDDLLFYHSIILDSKKYFIKCYKIREKKLIYDLNSILKMIYNNMPVNEISEINSTSLKIIKKSYNKLGREVKNNNMNTDKPLWIKNDKLKYIETIRREMNRTFTYHKSINSYFRDSLIAEIKFFKMNI